MRLDQFLVQTNICSRSEAKKYIKNGRVAVNGNIQKDSAKHIDENSDVVCFDGRQIDYAKYHYYMLNKPRGVVSATRDGLSATVVDVLKNEPTKKLFPVGRLDKDTEGLLLITDDGQLAHDLLSPKKHVDKVYYVISDAALSQDDMDAMCSGLDIGDEKPTLPAKIEEVSPCTYLLTIHEGRFHQVKRMFEACGCTVAYLKRMSMGSLKLDEKLEAGEYRALTEDEVLQLANR